MLKGEPLPSLIYSVNTGKDTKRISSNESTKLDENETGGADIEDGSESDEEIIMEEGSDTSPPDVLLLVVEDIEADIAAKWAPCHPSKELPKITSEQQQKAQFMRDEEIRQENQKRENRSDFSTSPPNTTFLAKREKRRSLELTPGKRNKVTF